MTEKGEKVTVAVHKAHVLAQVSLWSSLAVPSPTRGRAHTAQWPQEGHDRWTDRQIPPGAAPWHSPWALPGLPCSQEPIQDLSLTLEILFPSCLLPPPHQDAAPPAQPPIPKITAAPTNPQESAGVLPAVTPPCFLAVLLLCASTSLFPLSIGAED